MRFFPGLHQPSDARHFEACMVSVNRLRERSGPFSVRDWILDSGAFTAIALHGRFPHDVEEYASEIRRWSRCGRLLAAVTQDYMCEPFMVARTGLSIPVHQRLTVERFAQLRAADTSGVYVMPVLQGYRPEEYVDHVRQYGPLLHEGAWCGVGSVCKRNGDPRAVASVLLAIKRERPDLGLHGFGLKETALASSVICSLLVSADSMAWSYAARREGRNANDWREAAEYMSRLAGRPEQAELGLV